MEFTIIFSKVFFIVIHLLSPLLISFLFAISVLGYGVGRLEKWSVVDSFYYAFITATTVGYGDFRPKKRCSKILAIVIAVFGLLCTGIIVAAGLKAAEIAFANSYDVGLISQKVKILLKE